MRWFEVASRNDARRTESAPPETGPIIDPTIVRKLFIVEPHNDVIYASLCSALAGEFDIEVFYDRRNSSSSARASEWRGPERRASSDIPDRIRRDGFAVVRLVPRPADSQNIRWA
jgi:hypothetical protein